MGIQESDLEDAGSKDLNHRANLTPIGCRLLGGQVCFQDDQREGASQFLFSRIQWALQGHPPINTANATKAWTGHFIYATYSAARRRHLPCSARSSYGLTLAPAWAGPSYGLTRLPFSAKILIMSTATEEIIRVCEALPPEKQMEVADFARFLLTQQDDERWEQLLAYPGPRPKLETFLRESAAEPDEPLDPHRL